MYLQEKPLKSSMAGFEPRIVFPARGRSHPQGSGRANGHEVAPGGLLALSCQCSRAAFPWNRCEDAQGRGSPTNSHMWLG